MPLAAQQWCPTSVQVTVLQARGLRAKGKSGTNDAYALMAVGKEKYQTSVAEKCVAPMWKEEATFDLPPPQQHGAGGDAERSTLRVLVLHRALVGPDKLLGKVAIGLQQLSEDRTRNKTEWFKLLDKTGKADKDRGEVLVDIQFMRNNMTASMLDLSAAGKSRSRLGKFKDKVHGKKKESDAVVPALTQVLTDSEEEGHGNGEVAARKDEKKKKHKLKLFSTKSNLQKSISQSMSVLPGKNSSLSGSQSSGLNEDVSEGKKKFRFMRHKHSGSTASKDSFSEHGAAEQSNLCIKASHTSTEEPQPRQVSSGHGSMEDTPESSPPSVDSLRAVRQYSPWTEEETAGGENIKEDEGKLRREEEERIKMGEMRRKEAEAKEEERVRRQEAQRLAEEKRRQKREKLEEEERIRREEEERIQGEVRRQEEERRKIEEEKVKKEKEERIRREEEERIQGEVRRQEEVRRKIEEEKLKKEKEERIRREEEERIQEEIRRKEEEKRKIEEEKVKIEKEERIQEEIRREEEERRKIEEDIVKKKEEERIRRGGKEIIKKEIRRQEEVRRKIEEEKVKKEKEEMIRREEEERIRREEEERIQEEMRRQEEERRKIEEEKVKKEKEERIRREEEERIRREEEERIQEEMRRQEEERRKIEEEKVKKEEEDRIKEERRRQEEEHKLSAEKRRLEEEERREEERVQEEMRKQEDEEMLRRQECEVKMRLEEQEKRGRDKIERKKKEEEENKKRIEAIEKIRAEKKRWNEEEGRLMEERRILKEREQMRIEEKEKMQREEEERIREEERKHKGEVRARKEEGEYETLVEGEKRKEEERRREEEQEMIVMEEQRKHEEEEERMFTEEVEENKREEEERVRMEERDEEEAKRLENGKLTTNVGEEKEMKVSGMKSKAEGSAEITSTSPLDERCSDNPIGENPKPPAGAHSRAEPSVQQRSPSAASSLGREAVSTDDKDLIRTQREKRPAPRPPGGAQAQRQSPGEQDRSTLHPAQSNNQSKGVKTVSVSPQRTVHMIAPLSRSPTLARTTQSLMQSSSAKGPVNVAKHSKRPAPSRPLSVEEEPSSGPETALSPDGKIPSDYSSDVKPIVRGLNPFEDDEDKDELTAEDYTGTGSIQWPPAVSRDAAAAADALSQAKIKSSKKARAPPLPAKTAATSSSSGNQGTAGGHDTDHTGAAVTHYNVTQPCDHVEVQEALVQKSQAAMVQSAEEKTGGKKEGPPTPSRRLQPVKPLNPLRQQPVSVLQGKIENKSTGYFNQVWEETKVNSSGLKGPYSQLTQEELISLVLKQENQLSQKDKRISELEQYIDNLLVCVIEEKPSILMSMNSLK